MSTSTCLRVSTFMTEYVFKIGTGYIKTAGLVCACVLRYTVLCLIGKICGRGWEGWSKKEVSFHSGGEMASMSSRLPQNLQLSLWPMNRSVSRSQQLAGAPQRLIFADNTFFLFFLNVGGLWSKNLLSHICYYSLLLFLLMFFRSSGWFVAAGKGKV